MLVCPSSKSKLSGWTGAYCQVQRGAVRLNTASRAPCFDPHRTYNLDFRNGFCQVIEEPERLSRIELWIVVTLREDVVHQLFMQYPEYVQKQACATLGKQYGGISVDPSGRSDPAKIHVDRSIAVLAYVIRQVEKSVRLSSASTPVEDLMIMSREQREERTHIDEGLNKC